MVRVCPTSSAGASARAWNLDDEVVVPADVDAHPHMVAHVDDLLDPRVEPIGIALDRWVDPHALRAQRERGAGADPLDVDRGGFDPPAAVDLHRAPGPVHRPHDAHEPVVLPDELGDEGVLRLFVQHRRGGELLDRPIVEDRDAVRHGEGLALVVGDVDDGDPDALVDMLELVLHVLAELAVERPQRLVHQHEARLVDERPGHRHPLLLPARELSGTALLEAGELHHLQRLADLARDLRLSDLTALQGKREILLDRHVREERIVLEHHPDVAPVRRSAFQRSARKLDVAVGHGLEPGEHEKGRGLARPGGTEQGEKLAVGDVQIQVPDDEGLAVERLLDIDEAHQRVTGHGCRTPSSGSAVIAAGIGRRHLPAGQFGECWLA